MEKQTAKPEAPHVYIENIAGFDGKIVTIKGWLYNSRSSGKIRFLMVRDGTGLIQAVGSLADIGEEQIAAIDTLNQESSLIVTGTVRADVRAPGGFELPQLRLADAHERELGHHEERVDEHEDDGEEQRGHCRA